MATEKNFRKLSKEVADNKEDTENGATDKYKTNDVDFDDLLSSAGEFGRYQLLLTLSTFPFYFYGVVTYFTQMFLTEVSPNHWCWIPELENLTDIQRRNLAIPSDKDSRFGYSQCNSYVANWTDVLYTGNKPDLTWEKAPCQNGWEFNKSEIPYPTISSELGWVCDKDSYQATAQAIFFLGSIVGGVLLGWVSDRYGRLPATVVSSLIGCIGGVASIFARNFTEFAVYRFFMGISYDNCMMMMYLLLLEYVAPRYRTLIANISFAFFYSTSVVALPWIALACGHWKTLTLVTSLPMALAILAPVFVPESPRWLLSKGRVDDAVKKLVTIGKVNRKEIPTKLIEKFKSSTANMEEEQKGNILELMRKPLLRKMFICICLEYICCAIVFDALVRSIGLLDFDFFISFSAVSLTEFPSVLLLAFIMDRLGRRWLVTIFLFVSSLFSIMTVFIGGGLLSVMCAVIARFAVNMAFGTAMQWAAEMLPVSVRGSGVSFVHICGFVGALLSPYIVYLETYVYWLPLVLVGGIAAIGALIALALPETAMKDMPQTFDDAEELVKNQRLWDVPFLNVKKAVDDTKNGQVNNCFEM